MEKIKLPKIKNFNKKNFHPISISSKNYNDNNSIKGETKIISEKNILQKNKQTIKLSFKIKKLPNQFSFKKIMLNSNNNLQKYYEELSSLNSQRSELIFLKNKKEKKKKIICNHLSYLYNGNDEYEKKKKKIIYKLDKEYKKKLNNSVVLKEIRTKAIFNNELIKSVLN